MKTLQEYSLDNISEGLLNVLTKKTTLKNFFNTIQESVSKGVEITYKGMNGKEIKDTMPISVSFLFDQLIVTANGSYSFKDYAKQLYAGKYNPDTKKTEIDKDRLDDKQEEINEMVKWLKDKYSRIRKYNSDEGEESDKIQGGVLIKIAYSYNDERKLYDYVKPIMSNNYEEIKKDISKGNLDDEFIKHIYWSIFLAICKPNKDNWGSENQEEFKKNVNQQLKNNIIKIVGKGAEEKIKEWDKATK